MVPDAKTETINLTKLGGDFKSTETSEGWLYWLILALTSGQDQRGWIVPEGGRKPGDADLKIAVDLSINGRTVQFSKLVERLRTTFENAVDEQAKAIVEQTFDSSMEEFEATVDEVKDKISEFWQAKVDESQERRMEKALLLIDGISHLAEDDNDPKKLIDQIYMIAHAAHGHCGNPHKDWLASMDETAADLKAMRIIDVDKALSGDEERLTMDDLICGLNKLDKEERDDQQPA